MSAAAKRKEEERLAKRRADAEAKAEAAELDRLAFEAAEQAKRDNEIKGSARPGIEHLRVHKPVPRHYDSSLKGETGGNTRLMWAAGHGMAGHVTELIAQGVDVNARNVDGWTALYYAIYNDRLEVILLLLQAGALANGQANDGLTPLMMAATAGKGHPRLVTLLVEEWGAELNTADKRGWTALMKAAKKNNLAIATQLMEYNNTNLNAQDEAGVSCLMIACSLGHLEIVTLLVNCPSYTPPRDPKKKLTKEEAADEQRRADPSYKPSDDEKLALAIKARALHVNLQDNEGYTALCYTAQTAHESTCEILSLLLAFPGVAVNTRSVNYSNALTCACKIAHVDVVELLLAANADVNLFEAQKGTALITSCVDFPDLSSVDPLFWTRRLMIVEMLMEKAANGYVTDIDDRTPDQTAEHYGQAAIAEHIRRMVKELERRMG